MQTLIINNLLVISLVIFLLVFFILNLCFFCDIPLNLVMNYLFNY